MVATRRKKVVGKRPGGGLRQAQAALSPPKGGPPRSAELLLEIGTEELPHQFISPALRSLADTAERLLKEHRFSHALIRTFGAPRRLVLTVESLAGRQAPTVKEAMGPARQVAFDTAGQPTKAAIGFAHSQGVAVAELEIRQIPKGEYVFAVKREPGRQTSAVLADLLPALIGALSFPKSMRWNETGMRFARPIRWLLALYGGIVVPFQVGGVSAGNRTWGHRFLGTPPRGSGRRVGPTAATRRQGIPVRDFMSYVKELERHGVIPDQERRRTMILAQLAALTETARGHLHRDEDLLEQAIYTVEYPHAILGEFNSQYLSLPKEILITAMKEHEGFFSLMRADGSLLPRFISVTNMRLADMQLIREGNERVLAARLADAKFFFDEDRKVTLADRVEKLKGVTFHQKLGTLYQKQARVTKLAAVLASWLSLPDETIAACRRAAQLCKGDLLTGMVGEFPVLQGMMGGEYARHDGEPEEVSRAIAEQYLPHSMEGELPQTSAGNVLSLADRLDSIGAFFHVGIVPTGSEDPFGLRRHASAIVRIIVEANLRLDLRKAVDHAKTFVGDDGFKAVTLQGQADPLEFILDRLRHYGRTVHGLRDDVIEAVLTADVRRPCDLGDLLSRMKALQAITTRPEFDSLMVGFRRAHRLVEKERWSKQEIDAGLLHHPTEAELQKVLNETGQVVPFSIAKKDYAGALDALVRMKPAIDGFFEGVLVNAEDPALRANRLSLLCAVDRLFMAFADFSRIMVQGS